MLRCRLNAQGHLHSAGGLEISSCVLRRHISGSRRSVFICMLDVFQGLVRIGEDGKKIYTDTAGLVRLVFVLSGYGKLTRPMNNLT